MTRLDQPPKREHILLICRDHALADSYSKMMGEQALKRKLPDVSIKTAPVFKDAYSALDTMKFGNELPRFIVIANTDTDPSGATSFIDTLREQMCYKDVGIFLITDAAIGTQGFAGKYHGNIVKLSTQGVNANEIIEGAIGSALEKTVKGPRRV